MDDKSTPGTLLRTAHKASRLSQTEVARKAHVAQSVVSAYESDQREPSLSTFRRLIEATGHHLVITFDRDLTVRPGLPDTRLGHRLRQNRKGLLDCASRHGATNVRVFGSVARGVESPDSDIDIVVDVADGTGLIALASLELEYSRVLGVHVDLVASSELRPKVRSDVERHSVTL